MLPEVRSSSRKGNQNVRKIAWRFLQCDAVKSDLKEPTPGAAIDAAKTNFSDEKPPPS